MMGRTVLFVAAAFLLPAAVAAQDDKEPFNRRIEVTREYVPEVEGARKIDFVPRMQDTVTLKPQISCSITPTPWKTVFGTKPIAPVEISAAEYKVDRPVYLLLGGGYPAQSALDLYADFSSRSDVRSGIYLNHYGQWSWLENDRGIRKDGMWTENRLGVYAGRDFGRRSLDFDFKMIGNYYAPFDKEQSGCCVPTGTRLFLVDASLTFGDAFTDFSRFNYRFGIDAGTWLYDSVNCMGRAFADFGWKAGKGVFLAGISFDGWKAEKEHDWYAALVPEYRLSAGRWSLSAGMKVYYNDLHLYHFLDGFGDSFAKGSHIYVLPKVHLAYKVAAAFVPYVELDGDVGNGSYPALSKINPYGDHNTGRPKTAELKGGFRGSIASAFSYGAYAGYMIAELPYFVKARDTVLALFSTGLAPVNMFYAGLSAGFRLPFGLSVEGGLRYNSYNTDSNIWSGRGGRIGMGIPEFTTTVTAGYNYRDILFINAGVEATGQRHFASEQNMFEVLPATVNLKASIEYKTGPRFSVFASGDNLLNQKIYRYLGYPALGANVVAGVKMVF